MDRSVIPKLLIYNNELVHSAIGLTPREARDPSNEVEAYVDLKLKAKHNRKYPDGTVGDKVYVHEAKEDPKVSHLTLA